MKILHVIANLSTRSGGPSKACFEMARAVARLGHRVSVYTTNHDGPSELNVAVDLPIFRDKVEIRYFPVQHPRFWGFSIPLGRALRREIKKFDIVHIHSLYLFHNNVAAHYCRKYYVPYLIRPHGTLEPFLYRRHRFRKSIMECIFENTNIKNAAAVHFTTQEEKLLATPYIFKTNSVVVPNGIDFKEYKNLPVSGTFRSQYRETLGKKIILFFGRINFIKGFDILIPAFAKIAKMFDDVHLVITGPDNEGFGAKVRLWLAEEGVSDRATFTGMLLGEKKLAVLRDADIFVLPSYTENFGISVIEAMACGLPVVISDKVNIWREIQDSGSGKVVPCDSNRFAEAISELLKDTNTAKQMGEKGKLLVKERFQWSNVALSLEDVYRSIIS